MAYVHLKESSMAGGIAKMIGKLQGKMAASSIKQAGEVANSLRVSGCPSNRKLSRLRNQANGINNSVSKIDRRLDRFRRIPKKLKGPIRGLKVIVRIITSLPIPQSVPPGFGLPVNLTTKYSDLLVKIREYIRQIEEIIFAIEAALDVPTSSLKSLKNILSRTDSALTSCEISKQLEAELENGNITNQQLAEAGLLDDDGIFIFSTLGPTFIGNSNINGDGELQNTKVLGTQADIDAGATNVLIAGTGSGTNGRFTQADFDNDQAGIDAALKKLTDGLSKLQDSNIDKDIKDGLNKLISSLSDSNKGADDGPSGPNIYEAANGIRYLLEIINDPNAPSIAPRRFAVAKTLDEGVAVLKGQPSFSSDTEVLLDEVKFRLDNQLP